MSSERGTKLKLIVVTAMSSVVLTTVALWGLMKWSLHTPPAPHIESPTSIKVTLHPVSNFHFVQGLPVTVIPKNEFDSVMRLVRPEQPYGSSVNDAAHPLIGVVEIGHDGGTASTIFVRWSGVNPALVSVDGRTYYYAESHDDVRDGGMKFHSLITRIVENEKRDKK